MIKASNEGFLKWNWGGTWTSQNGVYNYKKKWAANESIYYYYNKVFKKDLHKEKASFFLNHYDGFYVIPFDKLSTNK